VTAEEVKAIVGDSAEDSSKKLDDLAVEVQRLGMKIPKPVKFKKLDVQKLKQ